MASSKISTRALGKSGEKVSSIGLGCMGLSAFYKGENDGEKVLERALELGCSFWDTADIYMDNEIFLSDMLKKRRNEIFLATKFGAVDLRVLEKDPKAERKPNSNPEYIRWAVERSLKRLGIETIDLYYQHRVDAEVPIEDTMKELASLVKEKKIRYIGLSEPSAETLRRAHKVHPVTCVQMEYSPWTLDIETNGIMETCKELGITIVAYSPLGRGFLTGAFKSIDDLDKDDWRRTNPRFQGENFQKNLDLVKELENIAKDKGISASQLCLAWVLAQGDNIIPIPGTKKVKYLEENLKSDNVKLTEDELKRIREVINKIPASGDRYDKSGMTRLGL